MLLHDSTAAYHQLDKSIALRGEARKPFGLSLGVGTRDRSASRMTTREKAGA
jgi:hypothetical protein